MNKILLEELYAQAKLSTKEGRMNAPVGVVAEKFAELIVKECAIFSMVITDDHYDVDALYRHFGVEE